MTKYETDVVVIGAGPVGLFAIFECGMVNLNCHVIDALPHIGGQCTALYPEKPIYDIPGFPRIDAADLIDNLKTQAAPFDPTFHLGQQVLGLTRKGNTFTVTTDKGVRISCRGVIIAAGVGAFGPNRPPLAGIEDYEGTAVFYSVIRKEDFRDKRIVIAGGGDSAVDWALTLKDVARTITLVHRRPKFRAAPESISRLETLASQRLIDLAIPYQLDRLSGDQHGQLKAVIVKDLDGNERHIEADILLPFYGLSMNLGPILEWGLDLENNHITTHPTTGQTSIPGVFAVGDMATYAGKLKLILTGFSEAANTAHALRAWLYPDEVRHFEYSTTTGAPGRSASA